MKKSTPDIVHKKRSYDFLTDFMAALSAKECSLRWYFHVGNFWAGYTFEVGDPLVDGSSLTIWLLLQSSGLLKSLILTLLGEDEKSVVLVVSIFVRVRIFLFWAEKFLPLFAISSLRPLIAPDVWLENEDFNSCVRNSIKIG